MTSVKVRIAVIDTGDVVLHRPTREQWTVASVRDGYLYWCGWPPGRANLSDCERVYEASDAERMDLLVQLAASTHSQADWAQKRLAAELPIPEPVEVAGTVEAASK